MSWIDFFNPFKVKWWRKDEWHKQKTERSHYIVGTHECPSWDVTLYKVIKYKNKKTCEERWRRTSSPHATVTTTFENPKNRQMDWIALWGEFETEYIDEYNIYEGPDYEER